VSGRVIRLALLAALLAGAAHAAQRPVFTVQRDGLLVVSALPQILSRPEVKGYLTTGLTTSFVLRVTAVDPSGRKLRGAGRVDVRYEPWDEVFLTHRLGVDRKRLRETVPSYDRLLTWWQDLSLPVVATGAPSRAGWDVRIDVDVIPFSQSEQRDTQRWFSDSIGGAGSGAPPSSSSDGSAVSPAGDRNLGGVLDLLIATSIKRRSLVTYSWKARVAP
jgi:hypothetical protein